MTEVFRYLKLHLAGSKARVQGERDVSAGENRPPVYISLSTTPERIAKIGPAIASVMDQTLMPDKIFLCIAKKSKKGQAYRIPAFLSGNPLVEISWVEKDLGPATKWFYTCNADHIAKGSNIIVLDDDQVYPKQLVEHYLHCRRQFPGAAFTLLGWPVPTTGRHTDRKCVSAGKVRILGADNRIEVTESPRQVHCMQGASSYMITKGMLKPTADYFEKYEAANFADDILISGLLAASHVPVYVLPGPFQFIRLHSLRMMRAASLYNNTNRSSDYNDQLYMLFEKNWPAV
ncbi:hypothetical protein [uncultured Imperialibacter sp.]|uniref:hypothetical protein n=1 Tax=uncultured Imperialibacter sp. TaxID=1672639 RepID=UPI0030D94263